MTPERNPCLDVNLGPPPASYHDALLRCANRYWDMLEGSDDAALRTFVSEFIARTREGYPVPKLCRWLGYIQRGVIEKGLTTVEAERTWTRPLFRPFDFAPDVSAGMMPEGWRLLPTVATSEMTSAGWIDKEDVCPSEIWWAMQNAAPAPATPLASFQARNEAWMNDCFGDDPSDLPERAARYGEESLELLQAAGMTKEQVLQLVDYVFARPVGEPGQEMGGAKTCLAGLATFLRLDMDACGEAELARVSTPELLAKIRGKRSRRHGRGPLPGTTEADLVPRDTARFARPAEGCD